MSQICKKCGNVADDGQEYCPNCYAELGALKKKNAEKRKRELKNMGKKAVAFSVIAAVAGICNTKPSQSAGWKNSGMNRPWLVRCFRLNHRDSSR